MKNITQQFLTKTNACSDAVAWGKEQNLIGKPARTVLNALIKADKLDWANWLIVRVMKRKQYLAYAIFAAEQVIHIYEKKYPNDKRPREAIEAAKAVLKKDTKKNRKAAADASAATYAYAASFAAYASASASAAAYAAYAAYAAADDAYAAYARKEMRLKILKYGLTLLK